MGAVIGALQAIPKGFPNCLKSEHTFSCHFQRDIQVTCCLMTIVAEVGLLPADHVATVTEISPVTARLCPQWLFFGSLCSRNFDTPQAITQLSERPLQ